MTTYHVAFVCPQGACISMESKVFKFGVIVSLRVPITTYDFRQPSGTSVFFQCPFSNTSFEEQIKTNKLPLLSCNSVIREKHSESVQLYSVCEMETRDCIIFIKRVFIEFEISNYL